MTAEEWQGTSDIGALLAFVKLSERKLRLFVSACARRSWEDVAGGPRLTAVEVAEDAADGRVDKADLQRAWHDARDYYLNRWFAALDDGPAGAAQVIASAADPALDQEDEELLYGIVGPTEAYIGLLRDLVGDPFRPTALDLAWLTADVRVLAQAAYEERHLPSGHLDPARLGVLADALEEAGAAGGILTHLRSPGPHVRGCWAVDLLLDRG